MITHTIATIEDFLIMEGFSMDMKRTRICGNTDKNRSLAKGRERLHRQAVSTCFAVVR